MDQQPNQPSQPVQQTPLELPPVPVDPVDPVDQGQSAPEAPFQPPVTSEALPPAADLPAVPVVTEPPEQTPSLNEAVTTPEEAPVIVSEPLGRPQEAASAALEWQASEYVEHQKSPVWFIVLAVITAGLVAAAIFLLKNYTFALLLVVMAAAIVVWAKRPAQEMYYRLDESGIFVNDKLFALHDFRAFGVLQDGATNSVVLLPNKRFRPGVTVYFPHELGEQIVDMLGNQLPMQELKPDWIDKLTRRLNF